MGIFKVLAIKVFSSGILDKLVANPLEDSAYIWGNFVSNYSPKAIKTFPVFSSAGNGSWGVLCTTVAGENNQTEEEVLTQENGIHACSAKATENSYLSFIDPNHGETLFPQSPLTSNINKYTQHAICSGSSPARRHTSTLLTESFW